LTVLRDPRDQPACTDPDGEADGAAGKYASIGCYTVLPLECVSDIAVQKTKRIRRGRIRQAYERPPIVYDPLGGEARRGRKTVGPAERAHIDELVMMVLGFVILRGDVLRRDADRERQRSAKLSAI